MGHGDIDGNIDGNIGDLIYIHLQIYGIQCGFMGIKTDHYMDKYMKFM